jgi:hypothetical protein
MRCGWKGPAVVLKLFRESGRDGFVMLVERQAKPFLHDQSDGRAFFRGQYPRGLVDVLMNMGGDGGLTFAIRALLHVGGSGSSNIFMAHWFTPSHGMPSKPC